MRPRLDIALALLVAVLLVVFLVVFSSGGSSSNTPTLSIANPNAGFDGAALPEGPPAPPFTLTDQSGHRVSLSEERGHVTVLAFLYSTCGNVCVVIAQQIRGALDELPHSVPVLIVSADPHADTPARVASFLQEASLTGRVHYLTGPPTLLKKIWRAYKVTPASAGRREFGRFASVLLINGEGRERDLFEQEQLTPESLAHDIGKLEGETTHP